MTRGRNTISCTSFPVCFAMLKACKDTIQTWPGISWHADSFKDLTEYRNTLVARKHRTGQETHVLSSVNLLSFLATDYRTTIATIDRLIAHNEITFDLLYTILGPCTLIVARCAVTGLEHLFQPQFFTCTTIEDVSVYQLGLEGVALGPPDDTDGGGGARVYEHESCALKAHGTPSILARLSSYPGRYV
ncbi:AAA domain-containing protein [Mycena sanguinolenta]|uniref:AAA domain-containing protein n=1 Tax=Mycena sanguinolenta TaxID=230812 RepID=A0A8H6X451_9AGAR|nr:AAA domain-containing protein [Mycena sanguinolenta]